MITLKYFKGIANVIIKKLFKKIHKLIAKKNDDAVEKKNTTASLIAKELISKYNER